MASVDKKRPRSQAGMRKKAQSGAGDSQRQVLVRAAAGRSGTRDRSRGGGDAVEGSRVLYVGRIPHGFYEAQMKGFFSQFGVVTRLRLSRNKRTGHSKHYAFVEFQSAEVAGIVAESMHNYLVAGHILQTRLVAPAKQHASLWKGANRKFRVAPNRSHSIERHNRERTVDEVERHVERRLRKEERARQKLAAAGIEYEFPGLREKLPKKRSHLTFED